MPFPGGMQPKTGGATVTYVPTTVTGGAAAGAAAGSLTTTLTGTVSWSVLAGALAVNATTGALTTTGTAPSSGAITGTVAADNGATGVLQHISVPVVAAAVTLGTLALSSTAFTAGTAAGTVLATITGQTSGSTVASASSDTSGVFAVNGAGTQLLAGVNFPASGSSTPTVSLTETLAGATGSPKTTGIATTISGAPTVPSYLGQVSTRSFVANSLTSTTGYQAQARTRHVATQALTSLQVAYGAWAVPLVNQTTTGGGVGLLETASGAYTIQVGVEYNGATVGTVKWSGATTGSVAAGATLVSDALTLNTTIPAGATYYLRPYIVASGALPYSQTTGAGSNGANFDVNGGECFNYASSVTNSASGTGTFTGTSTVANIYPLAIIANTTAPSFFLYGDSRTIGQADTPDANGDTGESARSIGAGGYAYINAGVAGDEAYAASRSRQKRQALLKYCSHVILAYGYNDVQNGARSAAAAKADVAALWAQLSGKPIAQLTLSPGTDSTDSWATLANQTPRSGNANRISLNTLIRSQPTPLGAVLDVASVNESSLNSGLWKAGGITGDGTHETTAQYGAVQSSGIISPASLASLTAVTQPWSPWSLFPPTNIYGTWNDADDDSSLGADVSGAAWYPKNNGGSYTQATAANQPTLTANAINSKRAFRFAKASSQSLTGSASTGFAVNGTSGVLMAAVVQPATIGTAQAIWFASINGSTTARALMFIQASGLFGIGARRADSDAGTTISDTTALVAGSTYLLIGYIDAASGAVTLRRNGAQVATGTLPSSGSFNATAPNLLTIGSQNGGSYLDALLGEVQVIPAVAAHAFDTADGGGITPLQRLEGELAHKWNVTLPSAHPFYASAP